MGINSIKENYGAFIPFISGAAEQYSFSVSPSVKVTFTSLFKVLPIHIT